MLGEKIKQLRTDRDMTQKDLASQLGLTPKMVSFYELGQRTPPVDIVKKICAVYNVSSDFLLGIPDAPATPSPAPLDLTDAERAHLERYRQLTSENRKAIDLMTENSLAGQSSQPPTKEKTTSSSSTTTGEAAEQPA